jgi:hypothetical protein
LFGSGADFSLRPGFSRAIRKHSTGGLQPHAAGWITLHIEDYEVRLRAEDRQRLSFPEHDLKEIFQGPAPKQPPVPLTGGDHQFMSDAIFLQQPAQAGCVF